MEFLIFSDSYEDAWNADYRGLTPANQYNIDYSVLGTSRVEPLLRDLRNTLYAAGMDVESAKGECNLGQHEIGFLYADALTTADNHAVYKTVAKEIAAARGQSITFMAKYDEREGNSCHIHLSLRGSDGSIVFWDSRPEPFDKLRTGSVEGSTELRALGLYDHFLAGVLATMADFTLLYAPNINSYKRFAAGSFAPTTIGWGEDNRTCAVRLVGRGPSARLENRVPGGDVNPYLALAAMIAGGRHGIAAGVGVAATVDRQRVHLRSAPDSALSHGRARGLRGLGRRPRGLRGRGRRPLHQHGRRRTAGLRRRRDQLGTPARLRADVMRVPANVTTVLNPATGEPIAEVEPTDGKRCDELIERAHRAFGSWRAVEPGQRARLLRRFADVVERHREELAVLEVANSGHPISSARWEADNVRDVLNYYSATPERLFGRQIPVAGGVDVTFHEPLGVVGVIVPWNFPMPIAGWGFAPALAAGNTVVLKPAELTPLTAVRLGQLALEAGLPEGVFTVIPGRGSVVGQRFVEHPLVRKICFTGSTEVGKAIMAGCAAQLKRCTLELGGKSANVIFADADLDGAAASAPYAVFDNAGQDCCARSRILVEASVHERFLALLEPAVRALRVVDPRREDAEMGPLISAAHRAGVRDHLDGVDVAFSGRAPEGPGFWMPPSVVLPRSTEDRVWREEVFGPLVAVLPFRDEDEAVAMANDTEYGLSGSIFTRDLGRALRVSRAIESGNLSVNSHSSVRYWTPFGGYKQSGLGRELGPDAPQAFTEEKNVFFAAN